MIYHIQTFCTYGYWPEDLKLKSGKLIIISCDMCGKIRTVPKYNYCDMCPSCAMKKVWLSRLSKINTYPKLEGVNEENTFKKFGYYSTQLSEKSNRPIVTRCLGCGDIRITSKNAYCNLCISCAGKNKPPVSDETREKQSEIGKNRSSVSRQRAADTQTGKTYSYESRRKMSATKQGVPVDEWTGFTKRHWCDVIYLNDPFDTCHRHHVTETIIIHIPAELHNHIKHCLKTGYNMDKINMLALQFINGYYND